MNETKAPENRAYKVTLILLLGLAAFSTAIKELNRLGEMVSAVHGFTRQLSGTDLVTRNEKAISTQETISTTASCPNDVINSSAVYGSSDVIAAARVVETEETDCETFNEPEVGAKVDLIAGRKANRNVPHLVRAKFAPARNLKDEISSIHLDSNWPARVEFQTLDRKVTVELPLTMVNDSKADAFESHVSPAALMDLLGKIDRKSHGKADTRRREVMIKRFERSINSRRAS